MNYIIFNIFISSVAFALALVSFVFLSFRNSQIKSVKYLFLLFVIAKFTELGNFIFIESSIQKIFGTSYYEISQIIGNILMILYPISNVYVVLSILSVNIESRKDRNKKILLLTIICFLIPILLGGKLKLTFLAMGIIILPILILKLKRGKEMLKRRSVYKTIMAFQYIQLIGIITLTILHFINNEPFDNVINVTTGSFIRGEDIGIINGLIILNILIWLGNKKLIFGSIFVENSMLTITFKSNWINIDKDKDLKNWFISKYYQNNLQFENSMNKILMTEKKFLENEVQYDNVEEMSNLLEMTTAEVKRLYKYFCKETFSKNIIRMKMIKAKNLIDNNYLNNHSIDNLMKLIHYRSKSAFINNFKTIVGETPVKYSKIKKYIKS